jgi:hypothetical protein
MWDQYLIQVLVPDQVAERPTVHVARNPQPDTDSDEAGGHPVDHDQLLRLQPHERSLRNLQKKDDRHPLRSPGHTLARDEAQVDRTRKHDQTDEHHRPDGLQVEAFFVGRALGHDRFVLA